MATQPDEQPTGPEPQMESGADGGGGGIGPGALATLGLGLIACAILVWFVWPRLSGTSEPAATETPASTVGELVTATPIPPTETSGETEVVSETPTSAPASPSPTSIPATATLPAKIQTDVYARVAGTGTGGLSFRSGPGLNYVRWAILPDGEILKITGGPEEADGVIWWRAVRQNGLVGWAAEQYLVPVEPPAWTPEPEQTPELATATETPEG